MILPYDEFVALTIDIELHHAIFYKLWKYGELAFDDNATSTACVQWDNNGEFVLFVFNTKYWESIDHYTRLFVICHEMLHTILLHGIRIQGLQQDIANIALDIVVNHMLVKSYGFDRSRVQNADNLCWVDTVFGNPPTALYDQSFEYYYNLLMKEDGEGEDGEGEDGSDNGKSLADDHQGIVTPDDFIENFTEGITPEESKEIEGIAQSEPRQCTNNDGATQFGGLAAGNSALGMWIPVLNNKVKKNKKWETIIKQWVEKAFKHVDKDTDQWAKLSRRGYNLPQDLMLPSESEDDVFVKDIDKLEIWFFLDASGSCYGYADRFFAAAQSVPQDKFNVRLFSFDTRIYELDIKKPKIRGGGGTHFHIMEDYIQNEIKKDKIKYPSIVFVITDGYGSDVRPKHPSRWCVLLDGGDYRDCFPKECHFYRLSEFK